MQNQDFLNQDKENQSTEVNTGFTLRDYFDTCVHYWYWFVISLVICVGLAFLYSKSRTCQYKAFSYILIKSDSRSGNISETSMFRDMALGSSQSIENEIYIIRSTPLLEQVVERLGLDESYYIKPFLRYVNLYKGSPIDVNFLNEIGWGKRINMEVQIENNDKYIFRFPDISDEWLRASFGVKVSSDAGIFTVEKTPVFEFRDKNFDTYYVRLGSKHDKAVSLWDNLIVKKADPQTNVLSLQIQGDNHKMCCDILDALIEIYNNEAILDKNKIAKNTEAFIYDRINSLGKDLGGIDGQIERLKISGNMSDLNTAAERLATTGDRYGEDVVEIETQLSLVEYIYNYLVDPKNKDELIPANIGISDNGITTLITQYNEAHMKYSKLIAGSGKENPWAIEQGKSLRTLHANILRSVENLRNSMQIKKNQAKAQERIARSRMSSATSQEKVINDVLRQQKIKEELYLYLLNKREENALRLAITEPNAKVIEKGGGDAVIIYPVPSTILSIGFAAGLLLPAIIFYLIFWIQSLDTKIHSRADVEDITSIPVIGEIPAKKKSQEGKEIIVRETGKDRISEAMRIVRSNLEFIKSAEEGNGVVAQMTSTIPGEGKSYVAINLALSFAQTGKKVIAIDCDLRKGKFSKLIGARPHKGLSSYLSGRTPDLHDIIQRGEHHPNLDTIGLGAIPPNPANLVMSERFDNMIAQLKKEYDYIFLDTVPFNIIADAALINKRVDMTIYIIRANMVDKRYIPTLERMAREEKIKNVCILVTDVNVQAKRYGYGSGYGYGYSYNYGNGYGYGYVDDDDESDGDEKEHKTDDSAQV